MVHRLACRTRKTNLFLSLNFINFKDSSSNTKIKTNNNFKIEKIIYIT